MGALSHVGPLPLAASLLVGLSSLFAVAPLRDVATLQDLPGIQLMRPGAYLAIAPLSDVLDTLSLLSARQHLAFAIGVFCVWTLVRVARRRAGRGGAAGKPGR